FSYRDSSGKPAGYAIAICEKVALALKAKPEWVDLGSGDRFAAVKDGKVDLLCAGGVPTLARREQVSFSIPVFLGGTSALLRKDAPDQLTSILEGRPEPYRPRWRATLGQVLRGRTFVAVRGTTAEAWLAQKRGEFQIDAKVETVDSFADGVRRVADGSADALFGDRALLLGAASSATPNELIVLERYFTDEAAALALMRSDEDFRLAVDRALSTLYRSNEIVPIYTTAFGAPGELTLRFLRMNALPE
ncbi:MAG: amino acid ABC transporter substrate-binding protein, partial [Myxococcota bacterium]